MENLKPETVHSCSMANHLSSKQMELHYPRIPKPYWDQRKVKTMQGSWHEYDCLYTFWTSYGTKKEVENLIFPDKMIFAEFMSICAENDMKVILRPGPYVCAEWEMEDYHGGS